MHTDPKTNGTLTFDWTLNDEGCGSLVASAVVAYGPDGMPILAEEPGRVDRLGPQSFLASRGGRQRTAATARSLVETACLERLQATAKHLAS